ncbi:unnamed protein product [Caenorhabditis auriculariae]|uniref:Abnormal cell migration protein 18-like fibronectin type I domain-containing protein n=1 Tax=Caenorhabditis auriculariae TaxID=2777116 RepID=A0A8S1HSA7_9PELO|nr:unnamed protein product [Caenorhabditis auriculariae]
MSAGTRPSVLDHNLLEQLIAPSPIPFNRHFKVSLTTLRQHRRLRFFFALSMLPVLLFLVGAAAARTSTFSDGSDGDKIVLTAHGMGVDDASRVVIPVHDGRIPALPCVMLNAGTHEHGSTFTKNNFHYSCRNGTAEVIACVADDGSVVQLGRTFVRAGLRHKCSVQGEQVMYEQEAMCYENGMHYNVGDSFRNGSFKLTCRQNGVVVDGCYMHDGAGVLQAGESRIEDGKRHECEILGPGKVRYVVKMMGCLHEGSQYNVGQIWTHQHVRYQCKNDGSINVLGCIDEGMFVEIGRDLLMNGLAYRCYQVGNTTFFHKFACDGPSLSHCIANSLRKKRRVA